MSVNNNNILEEFEQEVAYKECHRNHAVALGRIVYDGCLEFLQPNAGDDANCVVCGCHRNFHRKRIIYNPVIRRQPPPVISDEDTDSDDDMYDEGTDEEYTGSGLDEELAPAAAAAAAPPEDKKKENMESQEAKKEEI